MLKLGRTISSADLDLLAERHAGRVGFADGYGVAQEAFLGYFEDARQLGHWWAVEAAHQALAATGNPATADLAEADAVAAAEFARVAGGDSRQAYEAWCASIEARYQEGGGSWVGILAPEWGESLAHTTGSGRSVLWREPSGFRGLVVCRPALPGYYAPDFEPPECVPRFGSPSARGTTPVFARLFERGGVTPTARETVRIRPGRPEFFATLTRTVHVGSSSAPPPGPWAVIEVGAVGLGAEDEGSVALPRHLHDIDHVRRVEVLDAAKAAIDAAFGPQDWFVPPDED